MFFQASLDLGEARRVRSLTGLQAGLQTGERGLQLIDCGGIHAARFAPRPRDGSNGDPGQKKRDPWYIVEDS